MPVIIAATDFTEVAENAVHYACNLAGKLEAEVVLLHTYSYPVVFSDMTIPAPAIADEQHLAEEQMSKLTGKLRIIYPSLAIRSYIIYGDIEDGIEQFTEKNEAPMLVVAGNSYTKEDPAWMESTLMQALRNMHYPLLAIPDKTHYSEVTNICFAFDNKYERCDIALVKLREITSAIGANLHVLIAHTDITSKEPLPDISKEAQLLLEPVKPEYRIIYGTHTEETISDYLGQHPMDWLVLIPRHHSFFAGLFHKSQTRILVNNTNIPLMALHEN